jgi:Leucine-rich repeat (LRR) protein
MPFKDGKLSKIKSNKLTHPYNIHSLKKLDFTKNMIHFIDGKGSFIIKKKFSKATKLFKKKRLLYNRKKELVRLMFL